MLSSDFGFLAVFLLTSEEGFDLPGQAWLSFPFTCFWLFATSPHLLHVKDPALNSKLWQRSPRHRACLKRVLLDAVEVQGHFRHVPAVSNLSSIMGVIVWSLCVFYRFRILTLVLRWNSFPSSLGCGYIRSNRCVPLERMHFFVCQLNRICSTSLTSSDICRGNIDLNRDPVMQTRTNGFWSLCIHGHHWTTIQATVSVFSRQTQEYKHFESLGPQPRVHRSGAQRNDKHWTGSKLSCKDCQEPQAGAQLPHHMYASV